MHILQIIDSLEFFGGAQKLQVVFAEALAGRGHALTVLSLRDDDRSPVTARLPQLAAASLVGLLLWIVFLIW